MEVTTAREIIARATKDEVYDGPMPEDDDTAISEAQDLVTMAEEAYAKHIQGPEVEAILKLAAEEQNGDAPDAEDEDDAEPSSESDAGEPTQASFGSLQAGDPKLQKVEPWENYGEDTVKNISEGLNFFAEEDESNILDILRHVWQYETAHKNRSRILTFVSEMYEKFGGEVESESKPSSSEAEEEPDTSDEPVGGSDDESDAESVSEAEADSEVAGDDSDGDAESDSEPENRMEDGEGGASKTESSQEGEGDGSERGQSAYAKLVKGVEKELRQERVDVPKPPQEKAPELPWNWGEIKDSQLHELHMRYAVCAHYKGYRLALHERIAQHCKEAADALHNEKMVNIAKYDEKGKEKKVGLIEAEISQDSHVKRWRVLQRKHEQLAAADRREMDGYYKIVEALSRLETMRHNSWERSRR